MSLDRDLKSRFAAASSAMSVAVAVHHIWHWSSEFLLPGRCEVRDTGNCSLVTHGREIKVAGIFDLEEASRIDPKARNRPASASTSLRGTPPEIIARASGIRSDG